MYAVTAINGAFAEIILHGKTESQIVLGLGQRIDRTLDRHAIKLNAFCVTNSLSLAKGMAALDRPAPCCRDLPWRTKSPREPSPPFL
jgi:hypothetical protein